MSKEDETRPDPDALLSAIQHEEKRTKGGKLKIFLGMSAGVGKTYAMLEEAQERKKEGVDVVVGIVNTHGRQETARLVEGLEIIPEKWIKYKDGVFEELDIDTILARRPQIVLVDELAHTNVPGSRHSKRWQDVIEILDAGINVYTTLNVQHIESRKDMVEDITGINIRETVPDSIIERASQIKLIDLSTPELLQRLKEGKVYLGPQSDIAAKNFFQEDRLMALREIVLRLTADKVDHDLHDIMATTERIRPWKPRERLLVPFSCSTHSQQLLRSAKRLAFSLDAPWIALYVDTGASLTSEQKASLEKNMALARELGAEVITTPDVDIAAAIGRMIKNKNITQITIGRTADGGNKGWLAGPRLIDRITRENPYVEIHVSALEPEAPAKDRRGYWPEFVSGPGPYFKAFLLILALSILNQWLAPYIGYKTVGFIFLLGILFLSLFSTQGPVLFAAILSAIIWNIGFIPPIGAFHISNIEDIAFFLAFLATALITGTLINRTRTREFMLRRREESTQAIYEIVRIIATYPSSQDIYEAITVRISSLLNGESHIILKHIDDGLQFKKAGTELDEKEQAVANWVFENDKSAGWSTDTLSGVNNLFIPLRGFRETVGVLTFKPGNPETNLSLEEQNLLYTIAHQLANYIERTFSEERTRRSEYAQKIEKVQSSILDSISQEFRTPLKEIEAAAEEIKKEPSVAKEMKKSIKLIEDSSMTLRHTVNNILTMSQLTSGFLALHKTLVRLQKIVETCLENTKKQLAPYKVKVDIPDKLPPIQVDFPLMELAVCNLLINAVEYSPAGGSIEIVADQDGTIIWMSIIDQGPGVPDEIIGRVFDKFYRGPETTSGGMGLGLAIVKMIMEVHGGRVEVIKRDKGGEFRLFFALEETPISNEPGKDIKGSENAKS